ncbi:MULTISPECIES: response regulator transcription factor [Arsukibacterium]|uniref:response regulator transcription factor n=1 Tax=Arsukibacterium TaxID=336830 RepID=UPI00037447CF|nr:MULTISPECIES: response regulator transcription factor [Arsukibacterium]MAA94478.1 DNA-binding response regulator [Rheinheimera sp.]MBM33701.1 DNA-binding response regulator [Rheinheimera sp.]HAW91423.1 DNA-binding response regulator [Candidatus Azambacteria bacterium]|tara:strand:+ start:49838 stop:50533 length:696 start_codon:yes stop_codon:yes gene_type:complete
MSIVIIEDDVRVASFLERGLKSEGFLVQTCADGKGAIDLVLQVQPAVIILDRMLPNIDGIELCSRMRARGIKAKILILSALNEVQDRVLGLNSGADDYLGKPFAFEELLARIHVLSKRDQFAQVDNIVHFGELAYDKSALQVSRSGKIIKLTAKELQMLDFLMSQPGKVFSRERILANVWGMNTDPLTNVVDVYVRRLRRKIDEDYTKKYIHTYRGHGYSLNDVAPDAAIQ